MNARREFVICIRIHGSSEEVGTHNRLKHGIGANLIFFHVISMLQKICVIKEHFIKVTQKGIVRSCLPENFKLLTLPVLEIWSIMCSQNGHL